MRNNVNDKMSSVITLKSKLNKELRIYFACKRPFLIIYYDG